MDEDKQIIERVLQGEKEAFAMIVEKYQKSLFNYIGRMVGERELALDFTQDIFFKSYSSLHTYSPQFKFSTWLFKIASNFVIDFWRKKNWIHSRSIRHLERMKSKPSKSPTETSPSPISTN